MQLSISDEIRKKAQERLDLEQYLIFEHRKKAVSSNCLCPWCSTIRHYILCKKRFEELSSNPNCPDSAIAPWRYAFYKARAEKEMLEAKHWKLSGGKMVEIPFNFLDKFPTLRLTMPETIAQKKRAKVINL